MQVIKFEKENCAPCVQVSEHLNRIGVEYETINPYDTPEEAAKYKVRSVPTVLVIDNSGQEVFRSVGYKPEQLDSLKGINITKTI